MDSDRNVGGRDRLVRAVLAVVLSIVAVRWLKGGKKVRGLLAGIGAVGFGFNATTGYCGVNDTLDIDTTTDEGTDFDSETDTTTDRTAPATSTAAADTEPTTNRRMTCAACGDPIEVGQPRGPNDEDEIVHERCA
jgi:hypothetical protein